MSQSIHNILAYFREEAFHNRDLGDNSSRREAEGSGRQFEWLIAAYLCTEPKYADLFGGKVWLWTEWPHHKIQDTGIDVVAEETATGDVRAIQCKPSPTRRRCHVRQFWQPDSYVPKADINSFLATSSKHPLKKRLIVNGDLI